MSYFHPHLSSYSSGSSLLLIPPAPNHTHATVSFSVLTTADYKLHTSEIEEKTLLEISLLKSEGTLRPRKPFVLYPLLPHEPVDFTVSTFIEGYSRSSFIRPDFAASFL